MWALHRKHYETGHYDVQYEGHIFMPLHIVFINNSRELWYTNFLFFLGTRFSGGVWFHILKVRNLSVKGCRCISRTLCRTPNFLETMRNMMRSWQYTQKKRKRAFYVIHFRSSYIFCSLFNTYWLNNTCLGKQHFFKTFCNDRT